MSSWGEIEPVLSKAWRGHVNQLINQGIIIVPRGRIRLYPWELDSMDEYSSSIPSGTTPFKMWKRDLRGRLTQAQLNQLHAEDWIVGQYIPHYSDPNLVSIRWFTVVFIEGPVPAIYVPPDWSNYQRWLIEAKAEREAEWLLQSPGSRPPQPAQRKENRGRG